MDTRFVLGRVILFNYAGHGFLDLQAYDDFNHNRLIDA
jgi:tryptophan synthase beta chain